MGTFQKAVLLAIVLTGMQQSVLAQSVKSLEQGQLNPIERLKTPGVIKKEEKKEIEVLPPLPPEELKKQKDDIAAMSSVFIKSILVEGNTVLSDAQIAVIIKPYNNRKVTIKELHDLRLELSKKYLALGYVNSGAILPDQSLVDGVVTYKIIEGTLTEVALSGNDGLRDNYIKSRILDKIDQPLNVTELQTALKQLNQNSRIARVQAQLAPGSALGTSVLNLDVSEASPYEARLRVDNHRAPSVGAERAVLTLIDRNVTGWGDQVVLSTSRSDGLGDTFVSYDFPVNADDASVSVSYSRSDSSVSEEPFDTVNIDSKSNNASLGYDSPWINQVDRRISWSIGLDKRHSETTLDGSPISFSAGPINGETDSTSVRVGFEWVERSERQVLALRTTLRQGIDALGATINDDREPMAEGFGFIDAKYFPDGEFTTAVLQLQFARLFVHDWFGGEFQTRLTTQWASEPLLSLEKISIGGVNTVRGYRENQYVRDNGYHVTLEYRIPLFIDTFGQSEYGLAIVPFYDMGKAWDHSDSKKFGGDTDKFDISSIGLGLTYDPLKWAHFELFYGSALDDVPEPAEDDLQDDGVHFAMTFSWPFD